jgi:Spy/CpxP family protein refolding chaperone
MQRFCHHLVIAALAALMFIPLGMQAQEQGNQTSSPQWQARRAAAQRQRQHMAMLGEKLGLTDAQKAQFHQINKDMRKQGMAIRQDTSLTNDQKKQKMQELRKESHRQMFSVLTPEQKEKLKQMREEHKKEQEKSTTSGDQASAKKKPRSASDDDDPFAGMTSDDDDGPGRGSVL